MKYHKILFALLLLLWISGCSSEFDQCYETKKTQAFQQSLQSDLRQSSGRLFWNPVYECTKIMFENSKENN